MRHLKQGSVWVLTPAMLVFTLFLISSMAPIASAAGDEATPKGQVLFEQNRCNMCHSVSTAGIEAKAKSEKMRGPDLVGVVAEKGAEWTTKFIKHEVKLDGNTHKKAYKGSDEDLKTIVDWLGQQQKPSS